MSASSLVFPGSDGHLHYVPDAQGNIIPDFSNVGYMSGIVPLPGTDGAPQVPVKAIVQPPAKGVDAGTSIQAAIDQVSKLPPDASGFRGAVLLKAGDYQISGHIKISTSGVVLRGEGMGLNGTILHATGTDRRYDEHLPFGDGLVQLQGAVPRGPKWNGGDDFTKATGAEQHNITDNYVPVGARSFHVDSIGGVKPGDPVLKVGDSIIVRRPSTAAWIHDIGMDGPTDPWKPGTKDLDSDRVITQIDGNLITVDAPLTDALEKKYGGGTIFKYSFPGRIDHVGVENLRGQSDFDSNVKDKQGHAVDENHAWTFISLAGVENAWVRQITAQFFAFSAVDVQKMSKWVTVADCQSLDPVSVIGGGRRDSFELGGQLTLFKNCYSEHGRHDFILHSALPGPNVFLDCVAKDSFDEAGPHLHWDTGVLYDNVIDHGTTEKGHPFAASLEARNRKVVDGSLQGWTGANVVFWNCTADQMDVEQPPTAQNWAIGCTAKFTPTSNGFIESSNHPVEPNSLYHAQLEDRLAREFGVSSKVHVTAKAVPSQANTFSVKITNVSTKPIDGPVLIVFTSLPRGVGLVSVSGRTVAGDPFIVASFTGLAPGQSATAELRFTAPPSHGVAAEVLAGLPQPLSQGSRNLVAESTLAPADTSAPVSLDAVFGMWGDALERLLQRKENPTGR